MALTSADLDNGKLDLQTIGDVVNSPSTSPIISRLGNTINTLSSASAAIQANVDAVDAVAAQEIATVTAAGDQAVSDIQSESTQASDAITTARTDAVASINADVATVDVAKSSAITQFQENAREVGYNEVVAWSSGVLYNDFRVLVTNGGLTYKLRIEHTSSGVFATDLAAGKWLVYEPTALGTAAVRDAATSGTPTSGLVDAALGFYGNGPTPFAPLVSNLDTTRTPGKYRFEGAETGIPVPGFNGAVDVSIRDPGSTTLRTVQRATLRDGRKFERIELNAVWQPWVEFYTTANNIDARDFGLGVIAPTRTSYNGVDVGRLFRGGVNATDGPVASETNVLNMASSAATNTQLAMSWSSVLPRAWIRSQVTAYSPWVELHHTGNYQPETSQGLKTRQLAVNRSGGSITDSTTVAGSNLRACYLTGVGFAESVALTGTWKYIGTITLPNAAIGEFVRIA